MFWTGSILCFVLYLRAITTMYFASLSVPVLFALIPGSILAQVGISLNSKDITCYEPHGSKVHPGKYFNNQQELDTKTLKCLACACQHYVLKCEPSKDCQDGPPLLMNILHDRAQSTSGTHRSSISTRLSTTAPTSSSSPSGSSNRPTLSSTASPKIVDRFTLSPTKTFEPISFAPDILASLGPGETFPPEIADQDDLDDEGKPVVKEFDESQGYSYKAREDDNESDIRSKQISGKGSTSDSIKHGVPKSTTVSTTKATITTPATTPAFAPSPTSSSTTSPRSRMTFASRKPPAKDPDIYLQDVENDIDIIDELSRYKAHRIGRPTIPMEATIAVERDSLDKNYIELGLFCFGLVALLIAVTVVVKTICIALLHICVKASAADPNPSKRMRTQLDFGFDI